MWTPLEYIGRFFAGIDKWYEIGGFHRLVVVLAYGIVFYAIFITYMWMEGRKK